VVVGRVQRDQLEIGFPQQLGRTKGRKEDNICVLFSRAHPITRCLLVQTMTAFYYSHDKLLQ